jgi:hypothetical protein
MGSFPNLVNILFALEKWLHPKKPLYEERGEG